MTSGVWFSCLFSAGIAGVLMCTAKTRAFGLHLSEQWFLFTISYWELESLSSEESRPQPWVYLFARALCILLGLRWLLPQLLSFWGSFNVSKSSTWVGHQDLQRCLWPLIQLWSEHDSSPSSVLWSSHPPAEPSWNLPSFPYTFGSSLWVFCFTYQLLFLSSDFHI